MKKIILAVSVLMISASTFASSLNCTGTEPFWSVSIKNGILKYNDPVLEKPMSLKVLSTQNAAGFSEGTVMIIKTKFTRLSAISGACSDGMSDDTYSHHAIFETNGVVLAGCCNLK